MRLKFVLGVVGAEERDQLLIEGSALLDTIREEHFEMSRDKSFGPNEGQKSINWKEEESACIALALYARKMSETT